MRRLRTLLGAAELQAAVAVAFALIVSWPLWSRSSPSRTLLFMFVTWIVFSAFTAATTLLGREPETETHDEAEDEGESP